MTRSVCFQGQPVPLLGAFPVKGQKAKPFSLVSASIENVSLSQFASLRKVLSIFPSIDTPVCAASVRAFNRHASALTNTVVLCISADLPFAQGRFCGAEGLEAVKMLSTLRGERFKQDYGVAIGAGPLAGLMARAVIVLDGDDTVLYSQCVNEITDEPDYAAALAVL
jgi:Peroxiredoxin